MRITVLAAAIVGFTVAVSCSSSTELATESGGLALGQWGGDSAAMIVGDTAMHLHISCTYGDVSGRITLRANGEFDVAGSYLLRAFPVAIGPTMPARFTGRVDGATATIVVTITDTIQKTTTVRGPVVVTRNRDPRLMPCPICRRRIKTR
jgi:hypothetical protein